MWTLADESEGRKCSQIHSDSVQYWTSFRSPSLWYSLAITMSDFLHSASIFLNQLKLLITIKNLCEYFSYREMEIVRKLS